MDHTDDDVALENARLKRELDDLHQRRNQEVQQYEQQLEREKNTGRQYQEQISNRGQELESMRGRLVKLTRQLDEEVTRRDQAQTELHTLERKMENLNDPMGPQQSPSGSHSRNKGISFERDRQGQHDESGAEKGASTHASMKLMRVIDEWMRVRDLQQALLRNASINDASFATLVQVLGDCQSLQTLDLAQNMLTMDSCSDLCSLITNAPQLSFISLAENLFSMRSVGYFMTAVMERQNFERTSSKKLMPLDLLDLHGNEGLVASFKAPAPDGLLQAINTALGTMKLPPHGAELTAHVARALWQFLHDTGHPQVTKSDVRSVEFQIMDQATIRKMETALMKILLLSTEDGGPMEVTLAPTSTGVRSVTADLIFLLLRDAPEAGDQSSPIGGKQDTTGSRGREGKDVHLPPIDQRTPAQADGKGRSMRQDGHQQSRAELRDPFSDLKTAFEPPKEKLKTFNLKQIVTRTDVVLMNMLERLLETTEIDARDVETEQTLLEFACTKGNLGLAKLCYRRGADLSQRTTRGDTAFNIVTRNRRYDIMELLHTYGVKVNSADAEGKTALHIAASNDDVDAVCRLLEWGADVNIKDKKKRTPLHLAAAGGNSAVTMLLLEVGAELNAKDEKEYTAVAHAEAKNHFGLMDRLVQLGGKGHGLQVKGGEGMVASKSAKALGDLNVSAGMLKSSSLGRIGKVRVGGMPPPIKPAALQKGG